MNDATISNPDTQAAPLAVNPEHPREWDCLHAMDRLSWQRRVDYLLKRLVPVFQPRAIHVEYRGPYSAHMNLLADDGSVTPVGLCNLCEPE